MQTAEKTYKLLKKKSKYLNMNSGSKNLLMICKKEASVE